MTTSVFDAHLERVAAGERLSPDEVRELARTPDILPLGMLADALRKRLHGSRVTFLRVAVCAFDQSIADAVPPAARELRLTGSPVFVRCRHSHGPTPSAGVKRTARAC